MSAAATSLPETGLPAPFAVQAGLEEAACDGPADLGPALGFLAARLAGRGDGRPLAVVATGFQLTEHGALFARGWARFGLAPERLLRIVARKEDEALWALEEALKSGAVAAAFGLASRPSFVTTRRLDFAARKGNAFAALVRPKSLEDLSAARARWRIRPLPSVTDPFDERAPGAPRWRAELTRRRDGPPGAYAVAWDDEAHRLHLAAGLADHGLAAGAGDRRAA